MAIRIDSVRITPNPVNISSAFKLLVSITEYALGNVPLLDILNNPVYDISNKKITVQNDNLSSVSYTSKYNGTEMDDFILSVLGV